MELANSTFFLVGNIPKSFRSSNLRDYFSNFVEKGIFSCFHYKHRPEHLRGSKQLLNTSSKIEATPSTSKEAKDGYPTSKCCVVAVKSEFGGDFLKTHQNRNWSQEDGSLLAGKVHITKLDVSHPSTVVESDSSSSTSSSIPWEDLAVLPELTPPNVMPQGNVGTPLSTFMTLIRNCKLPGRVIKKLRLEFPKSRSSKRYGAVKFDYISHHGDIKGAGGFSDATVAESRGAGDGAKGRGAGDVEDKGSGDSGKGRGVGGVSDVKDRNIDDTAINENPVLGGAPEMRGCGDGGEDSEEDGSDHESDRIASDDDHDAEEWERYETFHDDVDKQERTHERLFEEDLEVVWEKGGSGLVFYTDASHWDQQDGDFDEKCSQEDDWDVDMSVYYEQGGGNKDARDMRNIEMERRLRKGENVTTWKEPGGFEKYTKGIGSKLLKRSGWIAGTGVGAKKQGIIEPVESDGQHPFNKSGFGYRGEKVNRYVSAPKRRKPMKDVIISTVYDRPEVEETTILRTGPPTVLKHRTKGVEFHEGGVYKPN